MPCPDDPICQRCPASTEDDVCLPHEREAAERGSRPKGASIITIENLGEALRPFNLSGPEVHHHVLCRSCGGIHRMDMVCPMRVALRPHERIVSDHR